MTERYSEGERNTKVLHVADSARLHSVQTRRARSLSPRHLRPSSGRRSQPDRILHHQCQIVSSCIPSYIHSCLMINAVAFTFGSGSSASPRAPSAAPVPPVTNKQVPPKATPQSYTKVPDSTSQGTGTPPSNSQTPRANSASTAATPLTGAALQKAQQDAIAAFEKLGIKLMPEDLAKFTPVDENQEILELMAEVRAYFEIASKVCRHAASSHFAH